MRHQRVALGIALATVILVVVFAGLAARSAAGTADVDAAAARHEIRALEALIASEVASMTAAAAALLALPEIRAAALGGSLPPAIDRGPALRGGADYLLVVGPGRRAILERGIPPTLVPTGNAQDPAERAVLTGAVGGAIVMHGNDAVLVAGASSGGGVDDVAVVLGRVLGTGVTGAWGRALGRHLTLSWDLPGSARGPQWQRAAGRLAVQTPIPLAVGGITLAATIDAPAPASVNAATTAFWVAAAAFAATVGAASLALVTSRLNADIGALTRALTRPERGGVDVPALRALGAEDVGPAAAAALASFEQMDRERARAVEDARVATARQLLGEHVIRSMHEGVLVERPDTTCIVCNPAAVGLLGIELRDVLGSRGSIRRVLGERLFNDLRTRAAGTGGPVLATFAGTDVALDGYEVPEPGGERPYFLVIIRDVTAVLETERLKRDVVSVVSHELRSPLTVLSLVTSMIRDVDEVERERLLVRAETNVERMRDLVEDMLDLARLESGQAELQAAPHDLAAICEEVMGFLQPSADAKHITLALEAGGNVTARCDRRQIVRAVTNLVSNAVKFSPAQSGVSIAVKDEGPVVTIEVVDSGPGVPPEERDRVFSRFYRASNARTVSGTGLGLTIVAQIAELHGGGVRLVPSEGGARFRLTLPR